MFIRASVTVSPVGGILFPLSGTDITDIICITGNIGLMYSQRLRIPEARDDREIY